MRPFGHGAPQGDKFEVRRVYIFVYCCSSLCDFSQIPGLLRHPPSRRRVRCLPERSRCGVPVNSVVLPEQDAAGRVFAAGIARRWRPAHNETPRSRRGRRLRRARSAGFPNRTTSSPARRERRCDYKATSAANSGLPAARAARQTDSPAESRLSAARSGDHQRSLRQRFISGRIGDELQLEVTCEFSGHLQRALHAGDDPSRLQVKEQALAYAPA